MIATGEERLLVLDRSRRVARGGVEAGGSSGCRRYKRVLVVEEKTRYQILCARIKWVSRNEVCFLCCGGFGDDEGQKVGGQPTL